MFKVQYMFGEKLWLLQKPTSGNTTITKTKKKTDDDFSGIRCPHCKWQPKRSSRS